MLFSFRILKIFLFLIFVSALFFQLIATWTCAFASLYTKTTSKQIRNLILVWVYKWLFAGITLVITTEATGLSIPIASIPWEAKHGQLSVILYCLALSLLLLHTYMFYKADPAGINICVYQSNRCRIVWLVIFWRSRFYLYYYWRTGCFVRCIYGKPSL